MCGFLDYIFAGSYVALDGFALARFCFGQNLHSCAWGLVAATLPQINEVALCLPGACGKYQLVAAVMVSCCVRELEGVFAHHLWHTPGG